MNDAPPPPTRADYQGPNPRNPFASDVPATRPVGAIANAEQQRSIAEVQARMIIARSNPRDPIRCMDLILRDCTRSSLAEAAIYQYSRGGSSISGPSIRLAEAIAQRWGNIASGIKELSRSNGYSECVAYAWDLESGFYDERQYQVRHWRDTKSGGYALTDERDLYELISNLGQRRKRAVLLTVIPGDVVEAAVEQCEDTLKSTADTSTEALARVVSAFEQFGVSKAQLEKRCQCRFESVRPAQIVQLRKIFASIKDGMSEASDWFEAVSGTWSAVDRAHETAKPAETRSAPRKTSRKGAAEPPPPAEEAGSGLFDQTASVYADHPPDNEKASHPETEGSRRLVSDAQATADVPPPAVAGAFEAWLVDGEGDPIPDADGVIAAFTDPVAFALAYVEAEADEFPGTIQLFRRANHDTLAQAMMMSTAVAPILNGTKKSEPERTESVDAAFVELPQPIKLTKAVMDDYNARLKVILGSADTPDAINHVIDLNMPTYEAFPPKQRLEAKALIETRQREISSAPDRGAPAGDVSEEATARDLAHDIYSLVSEASLDTWLKMPTVVAGFEKLRDTPSLLQQVHDAIEAKRTHFQMRALKDDMIDQLKQCESQHEVIALGRRNASYISQGRRLSANAPDLLKEIQAFAKTFMAGLPAGEEIP